MVGETHYCIRYQYHTITIALRTYWYHTSRITHTHLAVYVSTLLTDLTLLELTHPRVTKKKKFQLMYNENATKVSVLQKIILF